jgi:hypothetical protein
VVASDPTTTAEFRKIVPSRALGAGAVGALALGALAIGALAVGRMDNRAHRDRSWNYQSAAHTAADGR